MMTLKQKKAERKGQRNYSHNSRFYRSYLDCDFALLVKLDVGGFGSSVLYPVLKDVPVLNKILPNVSDNSLSSNSGDTYSTLQEAIDRINELENSIAVYKRTVTKMHRPYRTLRQKLKDLRPTRLIRPLLKL